MKKIIVNENCIGCGACIAIDDNHFDFNEDGFSNVISNENLDTDELKNAISSCPVNAIKLVDENNETQSCDGCTECKGECTHYEN